MGTLAYLTDTDSAKNTFTVGHVKINLDEAKVGDDGKKLTDDSAERVQKNSYHLLPGHVYDKDPTVTVLKGSDESYVRMLVTYTFDEPITWGPNFNNLFKQLLQNYDNNTWIGKSVKDIKKVEGTEKYESITFEYRYKETVSAKDADKELEPLFTGIKIPETWNNAEMEIFGNFTIDIEAQAIQASGFVATADKTAEDLAWEAFEKQAKPTT